MNDVYKTIESFAEGLYKEKGSKFISFAYPVTDEQEVKDIVAALKDKYYDARHHCYAYRLGVEEKRFRANDDGEPSSTAGKPILGQLLLNDLTNILIVVVRYFGGIKLGVSGLINAYKEAAADVIRNVVFVEKTVDKQLRIRFSYFVLNDVMRIIKEEQANLLKRNFELECEMLLSIRQKDLEHLTSRFSQIESLVFEP